MHQAHICILHYSFTPQIHHQKQTKINQSLCKFSISTSCNSDVKPRKKRISLTWSYHLHLKNFYLFFRQPKAEDSGIMPTLLLSSHRKYYGVILVFPGHTPLGNSILVQMSHPGSESLDTGSASWLIYFKILPNHSFFKNQLQRLIQNLLKGMAFFSFSLESVHYQ